MVWILIGFGIAALAIIGFALWWAFSATDFLDKCDDMGDVGGRMIEIPLLGEHGGVALIDDVDANRILGGRWHSLRNPRSTVSSQSSIFRGR